MSQFTTPFIGELIGKNKWKCREPFEYHVGSYPSNEIIKVPIGFITDFASVPRFLWPIISPIDRHGKAAVIHDYCYSTAIYNKKRSDEIFLEGMITLEVHKWKRFLMYYCVKTIGFIFWYRCRIADKKNILRTNLK